MNEPRYFNTSGPNRADEHYTIFRNNSINKGIDLVRKERYFTIWAPRQTGKSTFFRQLATELEKIDYKVAHINFENYKIEPLTSFLNRLTRNLKEFWEIDCTKKTIGEIFEYLEIIRDKKFVLIIDEVEGINSDYLGNFLHAIRNAYHSRQNHCLKSVILVGVANISGIIQDNASPFNIADNLDINFFTKEEVFELLEQHETETSQKFETKVKEKIYEITAGQPGLVNGFAYQLVEKFKNKQVIDYDDYIKIENWYLKRAIDKNIGNIVNKAKFHRRFVENILFNEVKVEFTIENEIIKYLFTQGVINEDKNGFVEFWVPLYKKRLFDAFIPFYNGEKEHISNSTIRKHFLLPDGTLNIEFFIHRYKEYINKRSFKPYREKDLNGNFISIPEAAMIYSFETYIDAVITELDGKIYREADAGLGKSDLIIYYKGKEYLFETKKYYSESQYEKGKNQIAYYCKKLGLTEGIYLCFLDNSFEYPEEIIEDTFKVDNILIRCYLVYYDREKDF